MVTESKPKDINFKQTNTYECVNYLLIIYNM